MLTTVLASIGLLAMCFLIFVVASFLYMLSKDPFDVFDDEDDVPPKDDAMMPFQNNCAGRNYWI